jgi:hypothetical protein
MEHGVGVEYREKEERVRHLKKGLVSICFFCRDYLIRDDLN